MYYDLCVMNVNVNVSVVTISYVFVLMLLSSCQFICLPVNVWNRKSCRIDIVMFESQVVNSNVVQLLNTRLEFIVVCDIDSAETFPSLRVSFIDLWNVWYWMFVYQIIFHHLFICLRCRIEYHCTMLYLVYLYHIILYSNVLVWWWY